MMKNNLFHCPEGVEIGGREYKMNTDFSVWIEIEQILKEKGNNPKRMGKILSIAYVELPPDPIRAMDGVLWFYSGGREKTSQKGEASFEKPIYDLKADFQYIWAAFLGEFGVDILKEGLHWWKFRRLLSCLGEECKFSKIVAFRSADISKIKNVEMRNFFGKMKKKYSLPDIRTPLEREMDTAEKLGALF